MLNKLNETVFRFYLARKDELEKALAELRENPPRFGDDLMHTKERLAYVNAALGV